MYLGVCLSPVKWHLLKADLGRSGLRRVEVKRLVMGSVWKLHVLLGQLSW